jgi:hypothetical protein
MKAVEGDPVHLAIFLGGGTLTWVLDITPEYSRGK